VHSACIGYQLSGEFVGIGGEIQYQWYKTKANFEQPPREFKHVQSMLGYSVYMLFTFPGQGSIDLALKPYFIFPSETYDHKPLQAFNGAEIYIPEEKWKRFGISLLFYNGDN
jgi:hypothetical protein